VLSPLTAHLLCLALVAADFTIRTWRTQCFLRGLRQHLPFREVFVHGALGEAASSLTPLRLGGEPARVWAMRQLGVPASAAVVCVGVELLATTPIILAAALLLGVTLAPEWWATAGPELTRSVLGRWPLLLGVGVLLAAAWWLTRRLAPGVAHATRQQLAAARGHARDLPRWPYVVNVPLTLLNIAARVAVLPVLAMTLPSPPPLGATVVASFILLYTQAILPTPAGAGAIELTFLGGGAGNLGSEEGELLLLWRVYTTLVGVVGGIVLAVARYRWAVLPAALRRRLGRAA
jgi:uncharacterized membrane protein YbhN (UPF0104 family)